MLKSDLDALNAELDAFVPRAALASLPLDRVLCHLFFIAEIGEKTQTIKKLDLAAMDIAVGWSYAFCLDAEQRRLNLSFEDSLFRFALDVYHQARHYNAVSGIMYLLYKGKLVGKRIDNLIETELGVSYDLAMAAADVELFGSDDPTFSLPNNSEISLHYAKCNRRKSAFRQLKYTLPDDLFTCVLGLVHEASDRNWQLDPSLDVGGYSLGDFRRLIEALAAFAQIHHYCNAAAPSQEIPINQIWLNSLLKLASRERWVRLLSRLSKLDAKSVDLILSDITYDPALRAPGKPRPDLMSTPFFSLSTDTLVLSNRLALEGNWERNFWKSLSVTKPSIHSPLSTLKEKRQIDVLTALLASSTHSAQLMILPPMKVQKDTDLDLLVLDLPRNFGLAIQLKWPYGPAYYRDMQKVWEEFDKGVEKLALTLPWLRGIPLVVVQKSGLSHAQLRDFRFEAMLLSKNSTGFGWLNYRSDIPICSERFMKWALIDKKVSLQRFWELSAKYAFKPKENVHYRSKVVKPSFGNIQFSAPTAFNVLRQFEPMNDVDWTL